MTRYATDTVYAAAKTAFTGMRFGDNEQYVDSKSQQFVERCRKFDGDETEDMISLDAIEDAVFDSFDPYFSAQFYSRLESLSR